MAQTRDGAIKIAAKKAGISETEYRERMANGQKRCTKCKTWKTIHAFGSDATRWDGRKASCYLCGRVPDASPIPVSLEETGKGPISRAARRGWEKRRVAFVPPMKGKKMSEESRRKMSESAKKRGSNRTGKRHTIETRKKISQITRQRTPRGSACHSYKDGKMAERRGQRLSTEYKRWRFDVFARDRFTCQHCGDARGGNLNAHHIKPFADYPELRFNVANGITLCETCHDKIHDKPDSTRRRRKARKFT